MSIRDLRRKTDKRRKMDNRRKTEKRKTDTIYSSDGGMYHRRKGGKKHEDRRTHRRYK
jgi:hypothetical protein